MSTFSRVRFFVHCGAVFVFHKRTIDKRRRLVLVVAFGVVVAVVCYFVAVFRGLVAVVAARGGGLVGNFSIRGHLPPQSLRKKYFEMGLGFWGICKSVIFGVQKVCKSGEMLDKWGNFLIILWHGEIVAGDVIGRVVKAKVCGLSCSHGKIPVNW